MEDLEVIVQRMVKAGESEDNIALVIKNYNKNAEQAPAKQETTEKPKGAKAEVANSGASGSTSAVKKSSLEYGSPEKPSDSEIEGVKQFVNRKPVEVDINKIVNPELYNKKKELEASVASKPLMTNSKEIKELKETNEAIERVSAPKKSNRKIANEKIAELDEKQNELTEKAAQLSKNSNFTFEEILKNDGTYQDIIKQKSNLVDSKRLDDELLLKIKQDTNSDSSNFFGKVARTFGMGDEEVTQTAKLNDAVEEQILLNLQNDNRTKEKIAKGYATLDEKEILISNAKMDVILNEKNTLLEKAKAVRKTVKDPAELDRELRNIDAKYNALLGEVGFDTAKGILKNNFKKTDASQKFDEMLSGDGFFKTTGDMLTTFGEDMTQILLKGSVGFTSDMLSMIGDVGTDSDSYSVFDAFSDTVGSLTNYNLLPSSKAADTRLLDEAGNLNLNWKTVSKSFAQTIPFTLAIINDAKKGKVTNLEVGMGKLLNGSKSAKMTESLRLIDSAFRHTLSDNINQAEELGLTGFDGKVYASTMSAMEGMAELIMPDTKFFNTAVGDGLVKNFVGNLKGAANREAATQVVKNFTKNVISELGEEEVVLASQDLLGYAMVVGHENSEFWDIAKQKELAAATVIMSTPLSAANLKNDYKGNLIDIYKNISSNINGVTEDLRAELALNMHSPETKKSIEGAIDWANNMHKAIQTSPANVTGEQIDLLMEKANLISEMKSLDSAFHPQYKEKIEEIDNKINSANGKQDSKEGVSTENVGTSKDVETAQAPEAEQGVGETTYKKELKPYSQEEVAEVTDAEQFAQAQATAIANRGEDKMQVSPVSKEDAQAILDGGGKLFMTTDGKSGAYVKSDGYMGGLFKDPAAGRSQAAKVLQEARTKAGGKFFDAFGINTETGDGTTLESIYVKNGFRPVARMTFNEEYADEGWDNTNLSKRPDNVFFVYDPNYKAKVGEGTRIEDYDEAYNVAKNYESISGYQKVAQAFRSAKIYKTPSEAMSKLSSNPVGLLAVAWDGAMETIATSIEITGNIDLAIRKGVAELKKSEWYQSLETGNKAKALKIFEDEIRPQVEPMAKAHVKVAKTPVKTTIRKNTGQVDTSEKVTMTKAKALKERFKNLARGSRLGAQGMKQLKSDFIKEVATELKSLTESNIMSLAETRKILSAVNQLNEKNYHRVAPLVDKVIDAIESKGVKRQIKQSKASLRKSAKSSRNPVNMRELAKESLKVNETYLDPQDRIRYAELLGKIQAGFKAATSKGYVLPHEARLINSLRDLSYKAEYNKLQSIADSMGLDGSGLSQKDLIALLESENVEEHIKGMSEEKAKEAREVLEKQAEYVRMGLEVVDGTQLSESEKKDVKTLKNADLSLLSSTDIRDFIKIVDNIITNNNFSSSANVTSKIRAYTASSQATEVFNKKELGMIDKSVMTDLRGVSLIFKKVFMNSKKSAVFNKLSGLSKLSMVYTQHKKAMSDLSNRYDKLFKELKSKNKSIIKPENTMLRGLAAQLIQGTTKEDFDTNVSRVLDHIERAKGAQKLNTRLGIEKLEGQFDKLKDFKSQDEVIEYMKGLKDGNWDLINFWLEHYDSVKEDLRYNTEVVHGKSFEEVSGNYLPIKMKSDGTSTKDVDNQPFFDRNGLPAVNASPTTIKRTGTKKLPDGRLLDLDFDSVMFNKASAVSIDVLTSAAYKDVHNFFKSPNMKKMFGNETIRVFEKKLSDMRMVQLGISSMNTSEDEITKNVVKIERVWKTIATTTGLGSITQYPKQYISVAFNVTAHLGSQGGLMFNAMFTDKSKIPLLDMVSISLRGDTQGGTVASGTRISEAEKRATKAVIGRVAQETGLAIETVREWLFYSLRKGDVNVAKSSWIAFYQKYLIDNGVKKEDIDMTKEHELIDEDLRQEAISYAELKVEETQISSDDSRGSEFYQSKSVDRSILRSIFLPYQSFNINSKMRMLNDIGILGSERASAEDKLEAGKSLLGTTAEVVTFQTMKYYVLAQVITMGKSAVMSMFGLEAPDEDDEDKEEKEQAKKEFTFKQWYSALAKDLNPLTIGTFAEDMTIETLNFFQYLAEGEDDEAYMDFIKRISDDGGQLFYRYKDKEERGKGFGASLLGGGGLYQIPYSQFTETADTFELMNSGTRRDGYGNLFEYDFDGNQKTFLKVAFAVELLSMFGLGEADSRRIFTKIRRDLTSNTPKSKIN